MDTPTDALSALPALHSALPSALPSALHSAATSTEGTPAPPSPRSTASPAPDTDAEPAESKADARARRIAAAVVRSRTEYQPEHAYTERGWFLHTGPAGPSKKDRQAVEYLSTYLTAVSSSQDDAARALAAIRALPQQSLPRELVTTGLRAAVLAQDYAGAAALARAARTHWRANVGLAVEASAALVEEDVAESTQPLLFTMAYALHHPVLVMLGERLHRLQAPELGPLTEAVDALAASRAWAFGDLFGEGERGVPRPVEGGGEMRAALASVEVGEMARALGMREEDGEGRKLLQSALRRMEGALGRQVDEAEGVPGERVERGVREL